MEYTALGHSGLDVSRLCVGCMSFGDSATNFHKWTLNAADSEVLVKRALDLGINFFDTANIYSAGTSEQYLGQAIKNNVAREKVALATKVYFNKGKLGKAAINREIDLSPEKLGHRLCGSLHHPPFRLWNAGRGNHGSAGWLG